mmetsp:Transcript_8460/g.25346  ORF Transcript_8460/g.25346 Transcript_8460/m.25346 type:complete len:388 (+) Transcript_8460:369-1532(+)|eukprot:CAMPEP_0206142754 /NCGR_PEP_ID=MMETSP1473-20131121/18093_1 /ASSEMBLY_ACC=CAM_ASM_001109 /TAXON_ID=1461547 /ORGANISM="Stichococcus sp, Strain RCC1054" /LENGTH=387 /DNA_ID=CAMNT_0053537873 /DNA_START=309 /DNA_END=1472 /DNA_ORIENTATION=+
MGIKGLAKLLADSAPGCFKEQKFEDYFGRKIAIDASMHIYQFLVVVGRTGDQMLTNEAGDVTSHLQGMFNRTVRCLESGMKPVYVFDGKPPKAKSEELARRLERRGEATDELADAKETKTAEEIEKYSKRTVRVTRQHNDECKRLLTLMGVPIIEAPSEAEAQCAALCKAGHVYAMASEDMDSLTFATPRLTRQLMAPTTQKVPVTEYDYDQVLAGLGITADQFVDVCILCGCDYAGTIPKIGPKTALNLVQKHGCMEKVLESLDKDKYPIPDPFPYQEARRLFKEPVVLKEEEVPKMVWGNPDVEGLVKFLVEEKGFNEDRVRKAASKISASKGKGAQGRLDSFFTIKPAAPRPDKPKKAEPAKGAKGKLGGIKKGGKAGGVTKKK